MLLLRLYVYIHQHEEKHCWPAPRNEEASRPTMEERMIASESRLSNVERRLALASAYIDMLIHHGPPQEYLEADQSPKNFLEALQDSGDDDKI